MEADVLRPGLPVNRQPERAETAPRARRRPRFRRSVFVRIVLANAGVIAVAEAILALTPLHIPYPDNVGDVVGIFLGLAIAIAANVVVLRFSLRPFGSLVEHMARVDLLRPGTRVPESGGAELSEVISEFNDMVSRLEDERRASSRATLQEQEDERRRIGRELHDEIGQRMTAILLQLRRARRDAPADILPHLDEAQSEARAALDEVGRLAARLRPGILDDLGLPSALEDLVASCARHSDVAIDAEVDRGVEVTADEELALYRIAQEALTNALRHSGATSVRLELRDDPDTVCLRVSDDGNGLAGAERYDSGIRGMRVRALQIGADLDIRSGPGLGVVVAVRLAKGLR